MGQNSEQTHYYGRSHADSGRKDLDETWRCPVSGSCRSVGTRKILEEAIEL